MLLSLLSYLPNYLSRQIIIIEAIAIAVAVAVAVTVTVTVTITIGCTDILVSTNI